MKIDGMEEGLYYHPKLDVFFYDGEQKELNLIYNKVSFIVEGALLEMISERCQEVLKSVAETGVAELYAYNS